MDAEQFLEEIDRLLDLEWAADKTRSRPAPLLPGEDPAALDLDNARHWATVYTELVTFKRELLAAASGPTEAFPPPGISGDAPERTVWEHELQRLEVHLAYWRERSR